ncbi:hypothetical protein [Actinomadura sp. 9N215]|uniref:hypothetical protein n=1 Tax=Actinomadura sp. 9N215 TaxID=3375150 RepID=UPI0037B66378
MPSAVGEQQDGVRFPGRVAGLGHRTLLILLGALMAAPGAAWLLVLCTGTITGPAPRVQPGVTTEP